MAIKMRLLSDEGNSFLLLLKLAVIKAGGSDNHLAYLMNEAVDRDEIIAKAAELIVESRRKAEGDQT